jgi:hypothetical protein
METISRHAYGFRNFESFRLGVKVLCAELDGNSGRGSPELAQSRRACRSQCRKMLLLWDLVDLIGFEPKTSSMPFKKCQSHIDISAQNKRLSGG